jgi:hypothetical protein
VNNEIREQIKDISFRNKGYISTKEVVNNGINRYYINHLENLATIVKVKNGLYKWLDYDF